jgi:hypothetical protein
MQDRFLKRLRKKAKKGMRGWPIATIAFYGPNLSQATKVVVSVVPSEHARPQELRDWKVEVGDVRSDPAITQEILEFIVAHGVLSIVTNDSIIGCPHQQGIDYEGEWCPVCLFWHGRDRFTGQFVH